MRCLHSNYKKTPIEHKNISKKSKNQIEREKKRKRNLRTKEGWIKHAKSEMFWVESKLCSEMNDGHDFTT